MLQPEEYYQYYRARLDQYVDDVLNGSRVVGRLEILSIKLWVDTYRKKYYFDEKEFKKRLKFCSLINVKQKNKIGQIRLADWQLLTLAVMCVRQSEESDVKVVSQISISFSGKNGKSLTCALIAILALVIEDRISFNIPVILPTQRQAQQLLDYCDTIIKGSPVLQPLLRRLYSTIVYKDKYTTNKILITSADSDAVNGLEIGMAIIDEFYLFDKAESAVLDISKSKTETNHNPMVMVIGTFSDKQRYNYENYYLPNLNILEGVVQNDSHFILYCAQDDINKELSDSNMWLKSNPSIGIVKDITGLIKKYEETKIYPASLEIFKTENLNYWQDALPEELFLSPEVVNDLFTPDDIPLGSKVIVGCDFATNRDLIAINILWYDKGHFKNKVISLLPNVEKAFMKNDVDLRKWFVKDLQKFKDNNYRPDDEVNVNGYIIPMSTSVMDEELIFDILLDISNKYKITNGLCYDPYNALSVISKLEAKRVWCIPVSQSALAQNLPIKVMERLIYRDQYKVVNNPVVKWQALNNLTLRTGLNGNVKFDKKKTKDGHGSIDCWSAMLNCMLRWCEVNQQLVIANHKEVVQTA